MNCQGRRNGGAEAPQERGGGLAASLVPPGETAPRRPGVSQRGEVVVHFLLGDLLLVAVTLLQLADQRIPLAADELPVVVRELGPLGLELGGELLPLACDLVPVHGALLSSEVARRATRARFACRTVQQPACHGRLSPRG